MGAREGIRGSEPGQVLRRDLGGVRDVLLGVLLLRRRSGRAGRRLLLLREGGEVERSRRRASVGGVIVRCESIIRHISCISSIVPRHRAARFSRPPTSRDEEDQVGENGTRAGETKRGEISE